MTREEFDRRFDAWHESDTTEPAHVWIGVTLEEYAFYVEWQERVPKGFYENEFGDVVRISPVEAAAPSTETMPHPAASREGGTGDAVASTGEAGPVRVFYGWRHAANGVFVDIAGRHVDLFDGLDCRCVRVTIEADPLSSYEEWWLSPNPKHVSELYAQITRLQTRGNELLEENRQLKADNEELTAAVLSIGLALGRATMHTEP